MTLWSWRKTGSTLKRDATDVADDAIRIGEGAVDVIRQMATDLDALAAERDTLAAALSARERDLEEVRRRVAELEGEFNLAEWRGENKAYADVFRAARRVYAHPDNDARSARAVMTFAERYQARAILHHEEAAGGRPERNIP